MQVAIVLNEYYIRNGDAELHVMNKHRKSSAFIAEEFCFQEAWETLMDENSLSTFLNTELMNKYSESWIARAVTSRKMMVASC